MAKYEPRDSLPDPRRPLPAVPREERTMSTPIARWTPNGWEQWFTPSPEGLKVIEFVALAEGADKASRPRGRTAERVWIEEVDADAYAAWMAKHPNAKPVSASHLFASVREAERHLGY